MDRYDTEILSALQTDGRISWSQLAMQVSLSASAVQRRVESLINRGVIENFTVNLNEAALGHAVKAFVTVNVERQNTELAEDFDAWIAITHTPFNVVHPDLGATPWSTVGPSH